MEYNKNQFLKSNDKKVLHKVKKHWVVMSMALLMAIGGEAAATHVSVHADTTNNDQTSNVNTLKERLNASLQKVNPQQNQALQSKVSDNRTSSQDVYNQGRLSAPVQDRQVASNSIENQANDLHQQILQNATRLMNTKNSVNRSNNTNKQKIVNPNQGNTGATINGAINGVSTAESDPNDNFSATNQPYTLYTNGTFLVDGGIYNGGYFSPYYMNGWPNDSTPSNDYRTGDSIGKSYVASVRDLSISNEQIHGNIAKSFANMPNLRFVHMSSDNFASDDNDLFKEFYGDKNLQLVQLSPSLGQVPVHLNENRIKQMYLPNLGSWKDTKNGDTNQSDIFNGDDWINTANPPQSASFTVPVQIHVYKNGSPTGQVTSTSTTISGYEGDSRIIDLSKFSLFNCTPMDSGNVSVAINNGYYTDNGDDTHWINGENNSHNPTLSIGMEQNTVTDQIHFSGDSDDDYSISGTSLSDGTVTAPKNFHFVNGSTGHFQFNGQTHTFDVARNTTKASFNYVDWRTGRLIKTQNDVTTGQNEGIATNSLSVPSNYRLANGGDNNNPQTGSNNYLPSLNIGLHPQTYTIPVIPNDVTHYGYWGNAHYEVTQNGTLWLFNGDMKTPVAPSYFTTSDGSGKKEYNSSNNQKYGDDIKFIRTSNVIAPSNMAEMFAGAIGFNDAGDAAGPDGDGLPSYIFKGGSLVFENLVSADLSGMNTSNTISMTGLFHADPNLQNVNFGNIDTSNVKSMMAMFDMDTSLTSLNLNSLNTSSCQTFDQMFFGAWKLENLDIANFKMKPGTYLGGMFDLGQFVRSGNLKEITIGSDININNTSNGSWSSSGSSLSDAAMKVHGPWVNSVTGQTVSDIKDLAVPGHAGSWIQQDTVKRYNLNFIDTFTGQSVGTGHANSIKGANAINFLPVASQVLPNGYKIVPNEGSTVPLAPGQTNVNVPVFNPSNMITYGVWGTANYFLFKNGDLQLRNGDLQIPDAPQGLKDHGNQVKKISTYGVVAPSNATANFDGSHNDFYNVSDFDFSNGFDTSSTINMSDMFGNLPHLTSLDLGSFNTGNVNYMNNMFINDSALKNLDLSNFNINNGSPTETNNMFGAINLESLVISNHMAFNNNANLVNGNDWINEYGQDNNLLDGADHATGPYYNSADRNNLHQISINYLFGDQSVKVDRDYFLNKTSQITALDIPAINGYILKPSDPSSFISDNGVVNVPVDKTGNWGQAQWLLDAQGNLTLRNGNLNTNAWSGPDKNSVKTLSTSNVQAPSDISDIFGYLPNLNSLNVSGMDTSGTSGFHYAFAQDPQLQNISGLNNFKTADNAYLGQMLSNNPKLSSINLNGMDTSKVTSFAHLLESDNNLQRIYGLNSLTANNVSDMSWMFTNDKSLKQLDLHGLNTSNVKNMNSMFTGDSDLQDLDFSGADTSHVNNMNLLFTSDNHLQSVKLGPNTKLNKPNQNFNVPFLQNVIDANGNNVTSRLRSGTESAGTYYAAKHVDLRLVDQSDNKVSDSGKYIDIPAAADYPGDQNLADLVNKAGLSKNGYTILPADQQDYNVRGGNAPYLDIYITGQANNATNLKVNVIYENNHGKTVTNNVPVTITGRNGGQAYFDPANLSVPNGYTLDTSNGKTQQSYAANMTPTGASWVNGEPTIYFKGNHEKGDQVMINQVVESPAGMVMAVNQTPYTVNGDVGDTYTIAPNGVTAPKGDRLATNTDPHAHDNQSVNGEIFADGGQTRLSQPTDTLYYVDTKAKSTITVHYINQAGHDVNDKTFNQSDGAWLDLNTVKDSQHLPNGYSYGNNNPTSVKFGKNNKDVDINVVGNQINIQPQYYDPSNLGLNLGKASADSGRVGDNVKLSTSNIPNGYHLASDEDLNYQIQPSGNNPRIQLAANEMTLPITFKVNDKPVGSAKMSGKRSDTNVSISSSLVSSLVPQGYHLSSPQTYDFTKGHIADNSSNLMQNDDVAVVPNRASVRVHVMDENGHDLTNDDYTLDGSISDTQSIHTAPTDYTMDASQPSTYRFSASDIASQNGNSDTMNDAYIYVHRNAASASMSINIQYENNNGTTSNQPFMFNKTVKLYGVEGGTATFDPRSLNVPAGYSLDTSDGKANQSTAVFDSTGHHANWTSVNQNKNGQPTVYFKAKPSTQVPHTVYITQVKELSDGTIVGGQTVSDKLSDLSVGNQYTVNTTDVKAPSDFQLANNGQPNGSLNQSIKGQVTPDGLSIDHAVLYYVGRNDFDNPITLQYRIFGKNYDVEDDTLNSDEYGKLVDAMDSMPEGYHLDTSKNTAGKGLQYQFGTTPQNPIIYVQPDSQGSQDISVTLKFQTPQGSPLNQKEVTVPLNVGSNGSFDIKSSSDRLANDIIGYHAVDDDQDITGSASNGITISQNKDKTFTYQADNESLPVEYLNQNGQYVKADGTTSTAPVSAGTINGYYGQNFADVTSNVQIPNGYHYAAGNLSYTLNTDPGQKAVVMVEGNQVAPQITINLHKKDQKDNEKAVSTVTKTVHSFVGDHFQLDASDYLPAGYHTDGSQPVTETVQPNGQVDNGTVNFAYRSNALKPVHVVYQNSSDGRIVNSSDMSMNASDYAGEQVDTNSRLPNNVKANYNVSGNQDTTVTLSANNDKSLMVQVTPKGNGTKYQHTFHLIKQFYSDQGTQLMSTETSDPTVSGVDGASFSEPVPTIQGYAPMDGNVEVQGKVLPDGLTTDSVIYKYKATKSSGAPQTPGQGGNQANPTSHAQPIFVTYKVGNDTLNSSPMVVNGDMGQHVNVMQQAAIPNGYHLANGQNVDYQIRNYAQNPIIQVTPNAAQTAYFALNIDKMGPNGQQLGHEVKSIPVTIGTTNKTLNPSDYNDDKSYFIPKKNQTITLSYSAADGKLTSTGNTQNNNTLVLLANTNPLNDTGLGSLNVTYKDGGQVISQQTLDENKINSGFVGETVDASDIASQLFNLKPGYSLDDGQHETVNLVKKGNSSSVTFGVHGDPRTDQAHITIVMEDPNGHFPSSYQVEVPVSGSVGDGYTITPQELQPKGYSDKTDSPLSGTINADNLSQPSATFTYKSTADTNVNDLKSVNVIYLAGGQEVGHGQITASAQSHDYDGETVNAATRVAQAPNDVVSGYQLAGGQNVPFKFSKQGSPTVYLNVDRAANDLLTHDATIVQRFYDNRYHNLISVNTFSVPESGQVGDSFTIKPNNYQKTGYRINNTTPVTGTINADNLTNGTVTIDYVANMSSSKNSGVAPIYITYKYGNNTIGKSDQEIDGYMGQTVDALDVTNLDSTSSDTSYHVSNGANTLFTFGHTPQYETIQVLPNAQKKVGKIIVFYDDANHGDQQVNQITAEDYSGDNFYLSPYITNVPQGYQFKDVKGNGNQINSFNSGTQSIHIEVNKLVPEDVVYEDISDANHQSAVPVGQHLRSAIVGEHQFQTVMGTPLDYTKFENFVPNGYKFVKLGQTEPTATGKRDVIMVKHAQTHVFSTIDIDYVEHDANNRVIGSDHLKVHGRNGDPFNLATYENQIPDDKDGNQYVFQNVSDSSKVTNYFNGNQQIKINVQEPQKAQHYGKVNVHFVDANHGNQEVTHEMAVGLIGDVFDAGPFEHSAPEGYVYDGVKGDIPDFYQAGDPQDFYIKVMKSN